MQNNQYRVIIQCNIENYCFPNQVVDLNKVLLDALDFKHFFRNMVPANSNNLIGFRCVSTISGYLCP